MKHIENVPSVCIFEKQYRTCCGGAHFHKTNHSHASIVSNVEETVANICLECQYFLVEGMLPQNGVGWGGGGGSTARLTRPKPASNAI